MMVIYKFENILNGKVYVGQTSSTVKQRLSQHMHSGKSLLSKAIAKHGIDKFKMDVIDYAETRDELNAKEIHWIKFYDCLAPKGYNLDRGGYSAAPTEETRRKISQTLKGRFTGDKNPAYGKPGTRLGKPSPMKGKKHSKETRDKMREAHKKSSHTRTVKVINIDTGVYFDSVTKAAAWSNAPKSSICAACKGVQKTAGGYRWAYARG